MKATPYLLLILSSFLLVSCQSSEPIDGESDAASAYVELASEDYVAPAEKPFLLSASFMSDGGSFVYTFQDYPGHSLRLMDTKFEGSSDFGANFSVEGGSELTSSTVSSDSFEFVKDIAGKSKLGNYQVYKYSQEEGECKLDHAVVFFAEEALHLQLSSCGDDDIAAGRIGLEDLLNGLLLEEL